MGVRITIGGVDYEAETYDVSEDSTPTSSDDSTGSVGTLSFTLRGVPEPYLLEGKTVSLRDTRRGSTVGYVTQVTEQDNGTTTISCQSRLGRLNIYDVQAQPFSGTLQNAFRYYVGLASQTTDILVDPQIASRPVVFSGWYGELWFNLKQLAAAQDCEISLVSGVIFLRPLSVRQAIDYQNLARGRTYGGTTLARAVEIYHYNNRPITDAPVYPPGGWSPEVEVLTVSAGETTERVLELSSSLTYIQPPVMQMFVAQDYDATSVYTIVGDDGFPIQPVAWDSNGGSVMVSINQDTQSLTIRMRGATGLRTTKGEFISTFSLALGSDFTGNRYSTLRLVGTGVAFNKEKIRVRTGVADNLTGTDVGITIDNPFISTLDDAYTAGVRAAKWYAGEKMTLNGTVTSINRIGESGSATYPTYAFDQSQHAGRTYTQVQASYLIAPGVYKTYAQILEDYYLLVRDDFDNQVFGNAGGVRVWDRKSRRWYRVRTAGIRPGEITVDAEDDLKHEDVEVHNIGLTYAMDQARFAGRTYSERDRLGLYA